MLLSRERKRQLSKNSKMEANNSMVIFFHIYMKFYTEQPQLILNDIHIYEFMRKK